MVKPKDSTTEPKVSTIGPKVSTTGPKVSTTTGPKVSTTEPRAGGPLLESKTFFSTLEFAAVPDTPTDLFVPLVQQLWDEWKDAYNAADQHLNLMVLMSSDTILETWANCITALEGVEFQWQGHETHQISFARCQAVGSTE